MSMSNKVYTVSYVHLKGTCCAFSGFLTILLDTDAMAFNFYNLKGFIWTACSIFLQGHSECFIRLDVYHPLLATMWIKAFGNDRVVTQLLQT